MTDRERILEIFAKTRQVDVKSLDLEQRIDDASFDSLQVVEFLMSIEDEFHAYLSVDMDLTSAKTLGELVDLLEQKIGAHKRG